MEGGGRWRGEGEGASGCWVVGGGGGLWGDVVVRRERRTRGREGGARGVQECGGGGGRGEVV